MNLKDILKEYYKDSEHVLKSIDECNTIEIKFHKTRSDESGNIIHVDQDGNEVTPQQAIRVRKSTQ